MRLRDPKHEDARHDLNSPEEERQARVSVGNITGAARDKRVDHVAKRREGLVYAACFLQPLARGT